MPLNSTQGVWAANYFLPGDSAKKTSALRPRGASTFAVVNGVPEWAVAIDETAVSSTFKEAVLLRRYMDEHPDTIHSIIVVTDPYHSRRAKWIYEKVLGEGIKVTSAPVEFSKTQYSKDWWKDASSREFVWKEYLKYLYYILRYEKTSGSLKTWLSQFDRF